MTARIALGTIAATAFVSLAPSSASAADWGSYSPARMAYSAGALSGTAHDDLRTAIEAAGDTIAAPTETLTAGYLDGVDVFYTGMLSGGTGASAGELGTLSNSESDALESWIAAGGTLIVTVDSTGLPGDMFATVYESWGALFGMDTVAFVTDEGMASPAGAHPLTAGVAQYAWVNHSIFELGDDADVLGDSVAGQVFLAALEPSSGFATGGRVVVVGDHNLFTDNFIGAADNAVLAANIIQWAAGECGNGILEGDEACDDANVDDEDGCSAVCEVEDEGGTSTGGTSTETGDDTNSTGAQAESSSSGPGLPGEGSSSGPMGSETSSTGSASTTAGSSTTDAAPTTASQEGTSTGASGDTDEGSAASSGSGCTQGRPVRSGWALVLLLLGARRRRSRVR